MSDDIPQFGAEPKGGYKERPCAYAVVFNASGKLLALKVGEVYHLPGGGIDEKENPEMAVARETQEEAGCEIADLEYLGKANQFFSVSKTGPINKLSIFYKARLGHIDPSKSIEADHKVCWLTPNEFIRSQAGEFQKWAVKQYWVDDSHNLRDKK